MTCTYGSCQADAEDGLKSCRRCRERSRAYGARHRAKDPVRRREQYRSNRKRWLYGIDAEAYQRMLAGQRGTCAICRQPERTLYRGQPKDLAVDHDHDTGKVRGLLCNNCNRALGMFGDSTERLAAAIQYLGKN